jgi:hypothetical protein
MPKCSRVGCHKDATRHSQIDIGGMYADVYGCDEHFDEIVKSIEA